MTLSKPIVNKCAYLLTGDHVSAGLLESIFFLVQGKSAKTRGGETYQTYQDFSDLRGYSVRSVNRALQRLKGRGLINCRRGWVSAKTPSNVKPVCFYSLPKEVFDALYNRDVGTLVESQYGSIYQANVGSSEEATLARTYIDSVTLTETLTKICGTPPNGVDPAREITGPELQVPEGEKMIPKFTPKSVSEYLAFQKANPHKLPGAKAGSRQELVNLWSEAYLTHNDGRTWKQFTRAEDGQFSHVIKKITASGKDPKTVLKAVVANWTDFTIFASDQTGSKTKPRDLQVGYLLTHVQSAINFASPADSGVTNPPQAKVPSVTSQTSFVQLGAQNAQVESRIAKQNRIKAEAKAAGTLNTLDDMQALMEANPGVWG